MSDSTKLRWFLFDKESYNVCLVALRHARKQEKTLASKKRKKLKRRQEKFGQFVVTKYPEEAFEHPTLNKRFLMDPDYAHNPVSLNITNQLRALELARAFILGIPYKEVYAKRKKEQSLEYQITRSVSYLLRRGYHCDQSSETLGWFMLTSCYLPDNYLSQKIPFEKTDKKLSKDMLRQVSVSMWMRESC